MEDVLKTTGYKPLDTAMVDGMKMVDDIAKGRLIPLKTSLENETALLRGFLPTDHITLAGRTGSGKTSKLIAMMEDFINPAINPHYTKKLIVLFDSWEIAAWRGALKLIGKKAKMTSNELLNWEDRLAQEAIDRLQKIADVFKGAPIFINETSDSPQRWLKKKELIAKKYPYPEYQVVNICDHTLLNDADPKLTDNAALSMLMAASVKNKKKQSHINIWLSQMNRNVEVGGKNRDDAGTTLPMASDIYGSDKVYQASEFVLMLHRPGEYGLSEFALGDKILTTGLTEIGAGDDNLMLQKVAKNRNGATGLLFYKHELKYNEFVAAKATDFTLTETEKLNKQLFG